ncbi:hypothetical protein PGT21_050193 [Puccinia graminis f. sp. tritici]|uniref:Uncharacterized protein n=1 Tax=Puccinia graminis f. sp. tritici TaxID=56615 RepID=A0A5B0PM31_PUCGR|nr:hypothetical protein PGTUg99_014866 [Puccinia graminis f. sp. tritici]KAA1100999.1 hypothetical protein PGT21_050193 [Puccinia graminis f. sp. tritici]
MLFLNEPNVENSLQKAQDQTKDVIKLVFLTSRYQMLRKIAYRYWDITKNLSGESIDKLPYNKSIYQGYLKTLREILTDFKDVNLRCSSSDLRLRKFNIDFVYEIQLVEMNGEIGLNYLESKA